MMIVIIGNASDNDNGDDCYDDDNEDDCYDFDDVNEDNLYCIIYNVGHTREIEK